MAIIEHNGDDRDDREQYWIDRINTQWQYPAESVIQVGRDLIEAKNELGHGKFEARVVFPVGRRPRPRLMTSSMSRHGCCTISGGPCPQRCMSA